jgi:Mor family transcriptional regulator
VDDKVSKNRQQKLKGSQHGRAKLLEQDVLDIRASSETGAALSRKYNVSDTVIYNIRNRKTWQHI